MKKKIFFIITSVTIIILAIYTIINAEQIALEQIDMLRQTPIENSESLIAILEKDGKSMLIMQSAFIAILNLLGLKIAVKDEVMEKKGKMIGISIFSFLFSNSSLLLLTAVINFIALLFSKKKTNSEDSEKEENESQKAEITENKEIPDIEYQKPSLKERILALVLVVVYCSQLFIHRIIPENATREAVYAIVISYYVLCFVIAIICFSSTLKRDFKIFKGNFKAYFKYILPRYGFTYLIFIVFNAICLSITNQTTSVNQAEVNSLPLWFSIPIAVIWAPIVEETLYRGVPRRFIKNDVGFIILSTLVFAFVHTVDEENLFNSIVMMVPYATLGGLFGYVYAKTNNMCTNIFLHCLQNSIASLLSVLLIMTS